MASGCGHLLVVGGFDPLFNESYVGFTKSRIEAASQLQMPASITVFGCDFAGSVSNWVVRERHR
jgi:hypothetical protein